VFLWPAGGHSIAIYALTDYTDKEDLERTILTASEADLDFLQQRSRQADFRIAFLHLGSASVFPSPHGRSQVTRLIAAGADLVICTGSHFIKGYSTELGKPVLYGIGNHLFSYDEGNTEPVGMHAIAGFKSGRLTQLFVIPFRNSILKGDVGPVDGPGFASFKRTLLERSAQDPMKYFTDPNSYESLKSLSARFRLSDLRALRARHLKYAALILFYSHPVATTAIAAALMVLAGLTVRKYVLRRRRLRAGL
jgi:hypothetical protein